MQPPSANAAGSNGVNYGEQHTPTESVGCDSAHGVSVKRFVVGFQSRLVKRKDECLWRLNTMVHCWVAKSEWTEEIFGENSPQHKSAIENDGSCLLCDGHSGQHQWTPEEIVMRILRGEYRQQKGPTTP
jgi:hypothetical protein